MADSNEIWQSLLSEIQSVQPPVLNTPQPIQKPTIIQGVDVSHVQPELQQFYADKVNPINPALTGLVGVESSVNLTELNPDVPDEDEFEDEEIEIEEGVDTEFNASFSLQLPEQPKQIITDPNDPFSGLFSTIQNQSTTQPNQAQSQPFVLPQQEKRGRGRPRKVANDLLNNLPESLQDTDKSTEINPAISTSTLEGKEIILRLPKKTAIEIGESFRRIGDAIIESCSSQ